MDWQSDLNLPCRDCYTYLAKEALHPHAWRRQCKRQWQQRRLAADEHLVKRMRTKSWLQSMDDIERQHGESLKAYRQRLNNNPPPDCKNWSGVPL